MFEAFERNFPRDPWGRSESSAADVPPFPGLREFFEAFGGSSFRGGMYRAIHPADLGGWKERVSLGFPEFEARITCFGYDWLGSVFALDAKRLEGGQPGVVMFEPATGEALEIPANIQTFHNVGLMEFGEAALATSFYDKWAAAGGAKPKYTECVGYRKPLFLGGTDELENLEISDVDVYWHVVGQLIRKTKGLPEGTPVQVRMG